MKVKGCGIGARQLRMDGLVPPSHCVRGPEAQKGAQRKLWAGVGARGQHVPHVLTREKRAFWRAVEKEDPSPEENELEWRVTQAGQESWAAASSGREGGRPARKGRRSAPAQGGWGTLWGVGGVGSPANRTLKPELWWCRHAGLLVLWCLAEGWSRHREGSAGTGAHAFGGNGEEIPVHPNNTKIIPDFVYCLLVYVHM